MDLSYILNSPDVERVATALETIADKYGDTIPSSVKVALLQCFEHVAWTDADGQTYYDALYAALNGGDVPPEPEPFFVRYTPDNGLLSAQSYIYKTSGPEGYEGEETVANGELILVDVNSGGLTANSISSLYNFNDTFDAATLKARFKSVKPYESWSSSGNGLRFQVSNGTGAIRLYLYKYAEGTTFTAIYTDSTGDHKISTNIAINAYHVVEMSISGAHWSIKIDDSLLAEGSGLLESATSVATQVGQHNRPEADKTMETRFTYIEYGDDSE